MKIKFIKTNLVLNAKQDTARRTSMMITETRGVTTLPTMDLASKTLTIILDRVMQPNKFKTRSEAL